MGCNDTAAYRLKKEKRMAVNTPTMEANCPIQKINIHLMRSALVDLIFFSRSERTDSILISSRVISSVRRFSNFSSTVSIVCIRLRSSTLSSISTRAFAPSSVSYSRNILGMVMMDIDAKLTYILKFVNNGGKRAMKQNTRLNGMEVGKVLRQGKEFE